MYYNYQIDKSFSNFADVILRYSKNTRVQKLLLLPTSRYIYIYITIEGIMRHNSRGCGERDARLSASVIQIIHFTSFVTPYLSSYRPFSTSCLVTPRIRARKSGEDATRRRGFEIARKLNTVNPV